MLLAYCKRLFQQWRQNTAAAAPLLSEAEIQQLYYAATAANATALRSEHEVLHPMLGERSSVFAGSGYEFADNRPFSAGDDTRFINWRLLARSGQMYRKLFLEERRPPVWLVVDRRSAMRFGTQVRLKVSQAARIASYYLHRALYQQLACAAVILEQQVDWYKPVRHRNAAQPLQTRLIAACPPTTTAAVEVGLISVLRQLHAQLNPGCIVILISDFQDLNDDAMATLYGLAKTHTVFAYHILDPIECEPPSHGHYTIWNEQDNSSYSMACDDETFRTRLAARLMDHHNTNERRLRDCAIHYHRVLSNAELFSVPQGNDHGNRAA